MNNAKRKQEIREKVKEMKMRQQNWMKQKAEFESKSSNGNSSSPVQRSPDDVTTKKSKPVDNIERGVRSSSSNDRNNNSTERLLASHKSNAKFASWLKAKEVPAEDEGLSLENESTFIHKSEYNSNKYSDNYYKDVDYRDHKGSGGATTLRVPSERTSKVTSPEQGWDSEDETGEITAATLMSPEDFDSRADDIIAKVKGDLKLSTHPTSVYEEVRKSVSAVNNKMDSLDSQDSNLSSHVCPTCDKLMMAPSASPMLLIPCGHTQCSSCAKRTKFCPSCGCAVQSCTTNIMLEQIITNFHTKQTHRHRSKTEIKPMPKKDYREEYQNLVTREEILNEEAENIQRNISRLSRKLKQEETQVQNIEKKERHLESEITELQRQLQDLVTHKKDFERSYDELAIQARQEKNRLTMVHDSLTSVHQQIEKVKMLAGE
ncbi:uncharacterized protein LOC128245451 [Mya arenaria]|uniref:uncharacterized protein LOC128245451 n=1 Tax=Mya arenaria TaxID=6604 RepID=UPI0022DF0C52|nr:uncharacterized protein LOC128245451 [Mya arenaria]